MKWIGEYLVGIVGVCVVASVGRKMLRGSKQFSTLGNVIIGIFLIFSVLSPVLEIDWNSTLWAPADLMSGYDQVQAEAQIYQEEALRQRIKDEVQAYVWNKAHALGLTVTLEITLSSEYPYAPASIVIQGPVSPYAKTQLSAYISEQLGIPKEAQTWISAAF